MTEEIWMWVPGFESRYEVSNLGFVRSSPRQALKGGRNLRWPGKVLSSFKDTNGYLYVNLSNGTKARKFAVHSIVLMAFCGPRPLNYECCHIDGCRTNARLDNLRWGSRQSNWHDKRLHGTATQGEQSATAILTDRDIDEIFSSKESSISLGKKLGVASSTIRAVRLRVNWRHRDRPVREHP